MSARLLWSFVLKKHAGHLLPLIAPASELIDKVIDIATKKINETE
jgi:hypothetical protein